MPAMIIDCDCDGTAKTWWMLEAFVNSGVGRYMNLASHTRMYFVYLSLCFILGEAVHEFDIR